MQIRANAWHLQVFLQAHVYERYWLDAGVSNPTEQPMFTETATYAEFEKECSEMSKEKRYSIETQKRLRELAGASYKAHAEWRKQQKAIYSANKSREISERLYSGRMSRCPYFWSVVSAIVLYYGFVRSTRPFRNFFNRIAEGLTNAIGAVILLGIIGYGVYSVRDQIPTPAQVVTGVKQLVQEYRQQRVYEQATEAEQQRRLQLQLQAQKVWEQEHPEEVRQQRLEQAQENRRRSEQNWKDFKESAQDFSQFVLVLLSIVVAVGVVIGLVYLVGKGFEWLAKRFGWGVPKEAKPPSALKLWLSRVWAFLEPLRRFCKDTKELVLAFAKAKKEKVCPYLEIENGNHQTQ